MLRAAAVRGVAMAATLLIASFIIFAALHFSPGSSAAFILGGDQSNVTPAQIAQVTAEYGLDEPLFVRYGRWLSGVFHGDWGRSYTMRLDVWELMAARLPTTLGVIALSSLVSISAGICIGLLTTIARRGVATAITVLTTIGFATPGFVAAMLLVAVFAVHLGWFPAMGSGEGFADGLWHLVLPSLALGLTTSCIVARITRVSMSEELHREHVQTAVIRGVPTRLVLWRHVLRNALIPIVTIAGLSVAAKVAGTVIIEFAFGLHGLGTLLLGAVQQKDVPVVQAASFVLVSAYVLVNLVVDLLYVVIDPRVRLGSH